MHRTPLDIADLGSGVTALVLNRPEKRNAFSVELLGRVLEELERLQCDDHCRVIVIAARGRVFSAGADIADPRLNPVGETGSSEALLVAIMRALADAPQPVIARVHGDVYGGAVGLVAAADIVLVDSEAHFVFTEARLGVAPTLASIAVVQRIGGAAALRMALLGERVSGREACATGLASRCVEHGALDAELSSMLEQLLQSSPAGLASCKRLMRDMADETRRPSVDELYALTRELIVSPDAIEAAAAGAEKRYPRWWTSAPTAENISALLSGS